MAFYWKKITGLKSKRSLINFVTLGIFWGSVSSSVDREVQSFPPCIWKVCEGAMLQVTGSRGPGVGGPSGVGRQPSSPVFITIWSSSLPLVRPSPYLFFLSLSSGHYCHYNSFLFFFFLFALSLDGSTLMFFIIYHEPKLQMWHLCLPDDL